jgi:hypothetical protein
MPSTYAKYAARRATSLTLDDAAEYGQNGSRALFVDTVGA